MFEPLILPRASLEDPSPPDAMNSGGVLLFGWLSVLIFTTVVHGFTLTALVRWDRGFLALAVKVLTLFQTKEKF